MLAAGFVVGSYATDARIVSMGRHDAFFMDEMSVFRNPANISIYPNMIIGSVGTYTPDTSLDPAGNLNALTRFNRDPQNPYFGTFVSYSLNQTSDGGSQYPMLSLGAVFNRNDPLLDYINPSSERFYGPPHMILQDPLGKVDLILGYALKNGGMLGVGGYGAFQDVSNDGAVEYQSSLFKGTAGINWPIARSMDLEVSLGGGTITAVGDSVSFIGSVPSDTSKGYILADADYNVRGDIRLFSALTSLNGDFVPHLGVEYVTLESGNVSLMNLAGGMGLNINIDKGFFWAGIEGLYEQQDGGSSYSQSGIGGRVSFGIERNVVWDWFVIRAGGSKKLLYVNENATRSSWEQNPVADASDDDHLGIGVGFNIENRLKMDFVFAEDNLYTLTNLISGPQHHFFNRFSATYSF